LGGTTAIKLPSSVVRFMTPAGRRRRVAAAGQLDLDRAAANLNGPHPTSLPAARRPGRAG
jgi:hypothetical protein